MNKMKPHEIAIVLGLFLLGLIALLVIGRAARIIRFDSPRRAASNITIVPMIVIGTAPSSTPRPTPTPRYLDLESHYVAISAEGFVYLAVDETIFTQEEFVPLVIASKKSGDWKYFKEAEKMIDLASLGLTSADVDQLIQVLDTADSGYFCFQEETQVSLAKLCAPITPTP